jgi:hypothetical protein
MNYGDGWKEHLIPILSVVRRVDEKSNGGTQWVAPHGRMRYENTALERNRNHTCKMGSDSELLRGKRK